MRRTLWLIVVYAFLCALVAPRAFAGVSADGRAALEYIKSPRLRQLAVELAAGNGEALAAFWREAQGKPARHHSWSVSGVAGRRRQWAIIGPSVARAAMIPPTNRRHGRLFITRLERLLCRS